jgi:hypothetical protein
VDARDLRCFKCICGKYNSGLWYDSWNRSSTFYSSYQRFGQSSFFVVLFFHVTQLKPLIWLLSILCAFLHFQFTLSSSAINLSTFHLFSVFVGWRMMRAGLQAFASIKIHHRRLLDVSANFIFTWTIIARHESRPRCFKTTATTTKSWLSQKLCLHWIKSRKASYIVHFWNNRCLLPTVIYLDMLYVVSGKTAFLV